MHVEYVAMSVPTCIDCTFTVGPRHKEETHLSPT